MLEIFNSLTKESINALMKLNLNKLILILK